MKNRILSSLFLPLFLTSLTLLTQTSALAQVPSTGLVGYWPFNGNANDESGNGNNGTVNGATLTTDRFGNANSAYNFDGVNDYIQYASGSATSLNVSGDFSVSFWLKTSSTGSSSRTIVSFGDQLNNNSGGVTIGINDGITQAPYGRLGYATQGQWRQSTNTINDNTWHFIAITLEGSVFTLYIDNVLNNQSTNQLPALSWNGSRRIGAGNYAMIGFYQDLLDDIGIYNRALTPAEITQLYTDQTSLVEVACTPFLGEDQTVCAGTSVTLSASGSSLACPTLPSTLQNGLVGYWPFCGNANDASSNGNNGTVNGATLTTDRFGNANSAYGLSGASNSILVNDSPSLDFPQGVFSLCAEVKLNGLGVEQGLIDHLDVGGPSVLSRYTLRVLPNNKVRFNLKDDENDWSSVDSDISLDINVWYSIVGVFNYTTQELHIYINGEIHDGTIIYNNLTGPAITPPNSLYIGNFAGAYNLNGTIDNGSIYNRALSASEIQQLYTLGQSTYLWSTGATTATINVTPTTTTTYTCTVTDANGNVCTDSVTVFVPQIEATDLTICAGETTTLSVSGITSNNCQALSTNLQTGLVGYWPFCGNANDASGNGNNGTVNGATLTSDRFGNANSAYSFDGVNDFIQCPSTISTLNIATISGWAFCNSLFGGQFVQIGEDNNTNCNGIGVGKGGFNPLPGIGGGLNFWNLFQGNKLISLSSCVNWYDSGHTLTNGIWFHYAMVKQNNLFLYYINGALVGTSTILPAINPTNKIFIGCSGSGGPPIVKTFFSGQLDDVVIHNRDLSAAEIQQLYTLGQTTYLWSNGATTPTISVSPTSTTTYTCTITTNGVSCTDEVTVVVSQPVASITPNGLVEICEGQSIALTANGGTSYVWNTGAPTQSITVTTEGLYTVTATDANGCTDTESQFVKVNFLPNIAVNNASICSGQSAALTATGGLSYVWSPATGLSSTTGTSVTASPSTNTVYTVTGTGANGCTNTATAAVALNALPTATITPATASTFCQGGSVVLNANTGAGLSYQWFNNAVAISGASTSTYTANASGSYTVVVTNTSTCSTTSNSIDVTTNANVDYFADADGDGFGDAASVISNCVQPQGYVTDNTDCDDSDLNINTAATDVCNEIDDDCNGLTDDGLVFETYYADNDGDTYGDANNSIYECSQPSGYVTSNTDCNDNDANQNAASSEICNGEDDDCDGAIDNGLIFLDFYSDIDADGFGAGDVISSCTDLGSGYTTNNTDCDDTNSNTNPSATETCNTIDDNCDGQTDDGTLTVYFIDNDGDTYGNPSVSILACTQPIGYTPDDTDCNDTDANINPGAEDIGGNGIDENCDGQIDNSIYELNSTIALYPNPTSSELNIQINSSIIGNDLYIFDAVGKIVYKQKLLSTQTTIPVSNFADGNYVVRVGEVVKRFVVEK